MKQPILEALGSRRLYFDGGYGTSFQAMGLRPGEAPETWNLSRPADVTALHRAYLAAGCRIIKSNTFGANPVKSEHYAEWISAGMQCARDAVSAFPDAYLAFDVGPTGQLLEPLGSLSFADAVSAFSAAVRLGAAAGADCILIETMNDAYETKAAVIAAKESCDLPVFVTNVYDAQAKLMTGASPEVMAAMLEGLGADAVGMNCSLGPKQLLPVAQRLRAATGLPVIVNPNAGLPQIADGKTVFAMTAPEFALAMCDLAAAGADILGGCCGTTPEFLQMTVAQTKHIPLPDRRDPGKTVVTSYTHTVEIGTVPVLIGERINPTGKPKCREALRSGALDYILNEGIRQEDAGAAVLDVNAGLPDIDEPKVLCRLVRELQGITDLPLQLDSSDPAALEQAMRIYNGKPMVNSVNGKEENMRAVLPLLKKYGGVVIALTLDETGIPPTAAGRLAIAHRILARAQACGIPKKDIVVDPLTLTVSSDADSADVTLETVRLLTAEGIPTSLGVSNISFGLPHREIVNAVFFGQALEAGLSCAIMNPFARGMMDAFYAHNALHGLDAGCSSYIRYAQTLPEAGTPLSSGSAAPVPDAGKEPMTLHTAIARGASSAAARLTETRLTALAPLAVINEEIVPALNEVGRAFEEKKLYLPQLISAADAASAAFAVVRAAMQKTPGETGPYRPVVLATVEGDIHDIGKNIVRVLLESYGFTVFDLGKNVPPDVILEAVRRENCRLVGLSALMTTTVPAMEQTIAALHRYDPTVCVMAGGAVLTKDYADRIGADCYSGDAMEAVRFAKRWYEEKEAGC